MSPTSRSTRPFGSWTSALGADAVARARTRYSEPRVDHGAIYWVEGRPAEGGRSALMRSTREGGSLEISPRGANVRTRVHEYGGGAYCASAGRVLWVDDASGRICERGRAPRGAIGRRHADLALHPSGAWLAAVEEPAPGEIAPRNRLVALGDADAPPAPLDASHDFVSSPAFSRDGTKLAWIAWDHPNMPWDASALYVARVDARGLRSAPEHVAGGRGESIFQPRFAPDGRLVFASDRSGWWNLYALDFERRGEPAPLCRMSAEFAAPQWTLGMSRFDFVDANTLLCVWERDGSATLGALSLDDGAVRSLGLPFTQIESLRVERGLACFVAASPRSAEAVYAYEVRERRLHRIAGTPDPASAESAVAALSLPESIEVAGQGGRRVQAFFYPPASTRCDAPAHELPPLLVWSHGGPTGVAHPVFKASLQYWTSRGFAVADVNYAGSSSFGRAARAALDGAWGVADVEDCLAIAAALAADRRVDAARLLAAGSSAGGFTTLCALVFHELLRAGASHYGIGDLEALARDTHAFESHYTDRLVAPYPEGAALYRARSPLHHVDRLSCPVIFFQGGDDRVVPPAQARAMVDALRARDIPHAYIEFEGEGHGFRRAENVACALDTELAFYARVLGFEAEAPRARLAQW